MKKKNERWCTKLKELKKGEVGYEVGLLNLMG